MALTVDTQTTSLIKFKTSAGCGFEGARGLMFFVGKGTGGRSSVMFTRNSQGEAVFARAADTPTSFEFSETNPT